MENKKVKIIAPTSVAGKAVVVGKVYDLPARDANVLIGYKKAEAYDGRAKVETLEQPKAATKTDDQAGSKKGLDSKSAAALKG